ncbi:MAG: ZIP family metal transporter [Steroidobacteraceae bacterium]|nr:ZIP family metal transporter [Steroidobacteraceae bacterium]
MLLLLIACAAFASTFTGGLLALRLHDKLHLILGFSAGAVIGVAFFDLMPESIAFGAAKAGATAILAWTATGFLGYLVMDRWLALHGATHAHAVAPDAPPARHGPFGAAVLCAHSTLDGVAIGLAFQASHAIGLVVAIAVLAHDFSDGINTMNLVMRNGAPRRRALSWLAADALAPALGIASTLLYSLPPAKFGVVLGLFAGFFLYLGASDLIPESYHAHPKLLTTVMTLIGAAVLYVAVSLAG